MPGRLGKALVHHAAGLGRSGAARRRAAGRALVELTHVAHRQLGEELTAAERETGREREPGEMVEVFLCVAGRRSGKSRAC
jgi:hypothetical protein